MPAIDKANVKIPLHIKVWFFSFFAVMAMGGLISEFTLFPFVEESEFFKSFVDKYIQAAKHVSEKTEFPEFSYSFIVWAALTGLGFLLWGLFVPSLKPRIPIVRSKKGLVKFFLFWPFFLLGFVWIGLDCKGGSVEGNYRDFWFLAYQVKFNLFFLYVVTWWLSVLGVWGYKVFLVCLFRKDIIVV